MLIATLTTKPIWGQRDPSDDPEAGVYELPVEWPEGRPITPEGIKKRVATHLAQAILDTQIPANMWLCNFPPDVQAMWSFPSQLDFGEQTL